MHSSVVKEHPSRGKCRTPHPRDHAGGALVPPSGTMEGTRCPVASFSPAFSYHPYRRPASGPLASQRFRRGQSLLAHTRRLSPLRTRRCQSGRHAPGKVVATRSRSSRSRVCCSSHQVQVRKQKEPRLGGMAGEMNSPHCRPGDAEHRKPFRPPLGRDSRQAENSVRIGVELRKSLSSAACTALASSWSPCPSRTPTPCHASPRH